MKKSISTSVLTTAILSFFILAPILAFSSDEGDNDKPKKNKGTKGILDLKATNEPDVPGALVIEIANNILTNSPDMMSLDWLGSWSVNLYYMYDVPIGDSHFSFNPGIGVGLEKYSFSQDITLATIVDDTETFIEDLSNTLPNASKFRKTKLANNYVDIPMEFRYHLNRENKRKSFKVALGAKIGFLYDAHTKVKYEDNDQTKKYKGYEKFNINTFRYGAYARLGVSGVSFYYYYGISEMFENKKGPDQTRAKTMMFGISIAGF